MANLFRSSLQRNLLSHNSALTLATRTVVAGSGSVVEATNIVGNSIHLCTNLQVRINILFTRVDS